MINEEEIIRDTNSAIIAFKSVASIVSSRFQQEFYKAAKIPTDEMFKLLKNSGVKKCRGGGFFFPKKVEGSLDGKMFTSNASDGRIIAIIMAIKLKDRWDVVGIIVEKVMTDRGLCLVCIPSSLTEKGSILEKKVIIVKDHCVRRAMERSPFKLYEEALGAITWIILKADAETNGDVVVGRIKNHIKGVETKHAHHFTCELYGKIVGTSVDMNRGVSVLIANTYLSEDMEDFRTA